MSLSGDSLIGTERPPFFRDLVCRVLLLVGVVGGLSISVFVAVASFASSFLQSNHLSADLATRKEYLRGTFHSSFLAISG